MNHKGAFTQAVCDSDQCCNTISYTKSRKGPNGKIYERTVPARTAEAIIKQVPKTSSFCPDCGSALFWKRGG